MPGNFGRIVKQWESKEIKFAKVLELTGLKRTTFYAKLKKYRAQRGGAVLQDERLQNEREMSAHECGTSESSQRMSEAPRKLHGLARQEELLLHRNANNAPVFCAVDKADKNVVRKDGKENRSRLADFRCHGTSGGSENSRACFAGGHGYFSDIKGSFSGVKGHVLNYVKGDVF